MRIAVLLALSLVAGGALEAALPKEDVLRRMISFHNRVYGVDNMLLKPFEAKTDAKTNDDIGDWRMVMGEATAFVTESPLAAQWGPSMATLNDASDKLIKERQAAWENVVRASLRQKPPVGLSRLDPAQIDFEGLNLAKLEEAEARLQQFKVGVTRIQKDSEQQFKFENQNPKAVKVRKDVLQVVLVTATTLETTLDKFGNDLKALRAAKDKFDKDLEALRAAKRLEPLLQAHRRAFGAGNLLLQPLASRREDGSSDVEALTQALEAITTYVKSRMGSMAWQEPMAACTNANTKLILARQRAWLDVVKDNLVQKPPVGMAKLDPAQLRLGKMNLGSIIQDEADLQKTGQGLGRITQDLDTQLAAKLQDQAPDQASKRKEALEAMRALSVTLTTAINKFGEDLAELKAAKVQAMNQPRPAAAK